MPVRRHQRDAVDLAQTVADTAHTRARAGARPGRCPGRAWSRWRSRRAPYWLPRPVIAISSPRGRDQRAARRDRRPRRGRRAVPVFWRSAPVARRRVATPLYLHGVPTSSDDWLAVPRAHRRPRAGPARLRALGQARLPELHDRGVRPLHRALPRRARASSACSLVVHDWGAVGLAFAQRLPERIERLVVINAVPFLPGYRWHRTARIWRTPLLGELSMGTTDRFTLRAAHARGQRHARAAAGGVARQRLEHFDQGTAARDPAPVPQLAAGGARGGRRAAGAARRAGARGRGARSDPYIPARFAPRLRGGAPRRRAARARRRRPLAVARPPGPDRPRRGVPERAGERAGARRAARSRARRARTPAALRGPPAWTLTALLGASST